MIRMTGDHHARTPSCFCRGPPPVPEVPPSCELGHGTDAYLESVETDARPRPHSGCTQRRVDFALSIGRPREAARGEVRTREAHQAWRSEVLDHYLGGLGHTE
jgi:hypothetical protein